MVVQGNQGKRLKWFEVEVEVEIEIKVEIEVEIEIKVAPVDVALFAAE